MDDDVVPVTEINLLDAPVGTCAWDKGCAAPATHNVCQYDPVTMETLFEGAVDANFCEPHARAMKARIGKYEA